MHIEVVLHLRNVRKSELGCTVKFIMFFRNFDTHKPATESGLASVLDGHHTEVKTGALNQFPQVGVRHGG